MAARGRVSLPLASMSSSEFYEQIDAGNSVLMFYSGIMINIAEYSSLLNYKYIVTFGGVLSWKSFLCSVWYNQLLVTASIDSCELTLKDMLPGFEV